MGQWVTILDGDPLTHDDEICFCQRAVLHLLCIWNYQRYLLSWTAGMATI